MPFVLPKSVFLLCPRTGSTWVRVALERAFPNHVHRHSGGAMGVHDPVVPKSKAGLFVFTFTREPEDWVHSRWAIGKQGSGWRDVFVDRWDADYGIFRDRVSDDDVAGYFEAYTRLADYVGRTEDLADGLIDALVLAGESFDESVIRSTPRQQVTDWSALPFQQKELSR